MGKQRRAVRTKVKKPTATLGSVVAVRAARFLLTSRREERRVITRSAKGGSGRSVAVPTRDVFIEFSVSFSQGDDETVQTLQATIAAATAIGFADDGFIAVNPRWRNFHESK